MLIAYAATWRLQKPVGKDALRRREAVCRGGSSIALSYCPLLLCGPGREVMGWMGWMHPSPAKLLAGGSQRLQSQSRRSLPSCLALGVGSFSQVFIQDQSKQICSACPERSPSAQAAQKEVTVIYRD